MLYVEWHGLTAESAPVLVMSAGLGGAGAYWRPQLDVLGRHYRIALYDHLGTGKSPAELPEGYRVEDMAAEVALMLDAEGISSVDFIGHAFGGLVGMALAHAQPSRINRLVVAGGWVKVARHSQRCFNARVSLLTNSGVEAYLSAQPIFLFPADWLATREAMLEDECVHQLAHFPGVHNVLTRIQALSRFDASSWVSRLQVPTLVITAHDDVLVPWTASRHLAESLPNGQFVCLAYGGHGCSVTVSSEFNQHLVDFLLEQ